MPTGSMIPKKGSLVFREFNKKLRESMKKLKYLKNPKMDKLKIILIISHGFWVFKDFLDSIFKPA